MNISGNAARADEAAALLNATRQSVLNIACAVGLNDPSHFARLFHRYLGMTPSAFRKRSASQPADPLQRAASKA